MTLISWEEKLAVHVPVFPTEMLYLMVKWAQMLFLEVSLSKHLTWVGNLKPR